MPHGLPVRTDLHAYNYVVKIDVPFPVGQQCVDLVREELGPDEADLYAPMMHGGVQLHKLQGVMHDTCNTANKTARLAHSLRETSGQLFYGYDNWEARAEEDRPWFDFLCGNHTRNLPMDEFNKVDSHPTIDLHLHYHRA